MTIVYKRIIWISAFALFFIIVPVLLTYAIGYKYNFDKGKFEPTGIFFIKTYPRTADININNEFIDSKSPLQLNRLFPGYYDINITKAGYYDYNKSLNIQPFQTTFLEDIVLFKKNDTIPYANFTIIDHLANKNYQIFLVQKNDQISLYQLDINFDILNLLISFTDDDTVELLSLSPNGKKLLYTVNRQLRLLNTDVPQNDIAITGLNSIYLQSFKWHESLDTVLYSQVKNNLYKIRLANGQAYIENKLPNIKFFFPIDNSVYYVTSANDSELLLSQADTDLKFVKQLLYLPSTDSLSYFNDGDYITLLDNAHGLLYLIDSKKDNIIADVFSNITDISWYKKMDDKILMWNKNEISVYYLNSKQKELVTRVAGNISKAWWHPNGTYVFYQVEDKINLIELDNRDKKNNYQILELTKDAPFIINNEGDYLYFYKEVDNTLYQMSLY